MPEHKIGTHQEWQAARGELAKLESEHAERNEEIKRKRLELPWARVEKEYEFDTEGDKMPGSWLCWASPRPAWQAPC